MMGLTFKGWMAGQLQAIAPPPQRPMYSYEQMRQAWEAGYEAGYEAPKVELMEALDQLVKHGQARTRE